MISSKGKNAQAAAVLAKAGIGSLPTPLVWLSMHVLHFVEKVFPTQEIGEKGRKRQNQRSKIMSC